MQNVKLFSVPLETGINDVKLNTFNKCQMTIGFLLEQHEQHRHLAKSIKCFKSLLYFVRGMHIVKVVYDHRRPHYSL